MLDLLDVLPAAVAVITGLSYIEQTAGFGFPDSHELEDTPYGKKNWHFIGSK